MKNFRHSTPTSRLPLTSTLAAVCITVALLLLNACGGDTPITPDAGLPPSVPTVTDVPPSVETATPTINPDAVAAGPTWTPSPIPSTNQVATETFVLSRDMPECVPPVTTPIPFPAEFAPQFPFPPGMQLTRSGEFENRPGYQQAGGYVPLSIKESVRFLIDALPKAGYTIGRGDSEPGEAEATFAGKGWRGAFILRALIECPEATFWLVFVFKVVS